MMLKHTLLLSGLLASCVAWSAATPRGSAYDSRMQNITYNSQNATVVSTRPGYVTMLMFDDDETVIDAQAGFPRTRLPSRSRMPAATTSTRCFCRRQKTGKPICSW